MCSNVPSLLRSAVEAHNLKEISSLPSLALDNVVQDDLDKQDSKAKLTIDCEWADGRTRRKGFLYRLPTTSNPLAAA